MSRYGDVYWLEKLNYQLEVVRRVNLNGYMSSASPFATWMYDQRDQVLYYSTDDMPYFYGLPIDLLLAANN